MINRLTVDELLGMYKIEPDRRYLLETEVNFPNLQSILWFPTVSNNVLNCDFIKREELEAIIMQTGLLLYRDGFTKDAKELPKMQTENIRKLNTIMYPIKISTEKITQIPRISNEYFVEATHLSANKFCGNYLLKYKVNIEDRFSAFVENEVQVERKHRLLF
jgi:hypothetical protein